MNEEPKFVSGEEVEEIKEQGQESMSEMLASVPEEMFEKSRDAVRKTADIGKGGPKQPDNKDVN